MMFLRREEQRLGVVEELPPLSARHYGQVGACHGGILYCFIDIQFRKMPGCIGTADEMHPRSEQWLE